MLYTADYLSAAWRENRMGTTGNGYSSNSLAPLGYTPAQMQTDLAIMAREFYGDMACSILADKPDMFREFAQQYAEMIVGALYMSCAGEFRYIAHSYMHLLLGANHKGVEAGLRRSAFGRLVEQLGGNKPHQNIDGAQRTSVGYRATVEWPQRLLSGRPSIAADFRVMRSAFAATALTERSIGGYPWAYGSLLGHLYMAGKLSPTAFVDAVFDQVHNGAPILSKVWGTSDIARFLDYKKSTTVERLALWALPDTREKYGLEPLLFALPSPFIGVPDEREVWAKARQRVEVSGRAMYAFESANYYTLIRLAREGLPNRGEAARTRALRKKYAEFFLAGRTPRYISRHRDSSSWCPRYNCLWGPPTTTEAATNKED